MPYPIIIYGDWSLMGHTSRNLQEYVFKTVNLVQETAID